MRDKQSFEHLKDFFEKVKTVGFIERIFFWKGIVALSYDAYKEFKSTDEKLNDFLEQLRESENQIKELTTKIEHQKDKHEDLKHEFEQIKDKYDELRKKNVENEKTITKFESEEDRKKKEYEKNVTELNTVKKQLDDDRLRVQEEREHEIRERLNKMKETWRTHEKLVEDTIKGICQRHQLEYVPKEKVPFKGKPDNTVEICEEFVIFDAKSPGEDDLNNFAAYIKSQAEAAKKYTKEQGVRKDIFLVIPSNAVEVIDRLFYNMADYNVYIVTIDSLEPILLSLKKIEDYEFMEQLSPEDRENICRVIGKFAHATKRRIQVDNYFANEMINILTSCETLPADIKDKVVEYEKSDKMNPPIEKRAKLISQKELQKDVKKIKQEAKAKEINTDDSLEKIETIPLYKEESTR